MTPLSASDQRQLRAAEGWIALENVEACFAELKSISLEGRVHPEVVRFRLSLAMIAQRWEDALQLAEALVSADAEALDGWINRSLILHELKRTAEAETALRPAIDLFPNEPDVPYDLACYACSLGKLAEGRAILERAFNIADDKAAELKLEALNEPDLAPLRVAPPVEKNP
jgi:tetratricopeptide (TPR) repeat protein